MSAAATEPTTTSTSRRLLFECDTAIHKIITHHRLYGTCKK